MFRTVFNNLFTFGLSKQIKKIVCIAIECDQCELCCESVIPPMHAKLNHKHVKIYQVFVFILFLSETHKRNHKLKKLL